jgi:hypothetical protein
MAMDDQHIPDSRNIARSYVYDGIAAGRSAYAIACRGMSARESLRLESEIDSQIPALQLLKDAEDVEKGRLIKEELAHADAKRQARNDLVRRLTLSVLIAIGIFIAIALCWPAALFLIGLLASFRSTTIIILLLVVVIVILISDSRS